MSSPTPCGLYVAGAWTKAGLSSCVHIKGQQRGEDMLFDCGIVEPSTFSASHVFCTHGHIDHIGAVVSHARARALTHGAATYYMPANCVEHILAVKSAFERLDEAEIPMDVRTIQPGDSVQLTDTLRVLCFPTLHRVPSLGYAIYRLSSARTLRAELRHLDRLQIKELVSAGENVFETPVESLQLCYTGDTVMAGLLQPATRFIFQAHTLIMELTYLDGDPAKAEKWSHVHISDIVSNAHVFCNTQIVFVHLSQKYNPFSRAIQLLQSHLPPRILDISSVSLYSFGSGEVLTRLSADFSAEQREVGWGWGRARGVGRGGGNWAARRGSGGGGRGRNSYRDRDRSESFSMAFVGGFSPIDATDPDVQRCAAYAMGKIYSSQPGLKFEVQSAERQVVAGLNYNVTVKATFEDNSCETSRITIWDQFGFLKVTKVETLTRRA